MAATIVAYIKIYKQQTLTTGAFVYKKLLFVIFLSHNSFLLAVVFFYI